MLKPMRLFRKVCLLAALLIAVAPAAAEAQVFQQGTITTGHPSIWSTNNVIRDGGAATNGYLSELGITSPAGIAFGIKNGPTTSPYTQFGVGVVPGSGVQITDTAIGGAAHLPINFVVNGNTSLTVNDAGILVNGVPIVGNTIPNNTVLGNVSGSTAAPGAITGSQVSTMLGLGTAAFVNTGTSGATIPLLSAANTWSLPQTFGVNLGTGGSLVLNGATSGSATVQVAAAAGVGTIFRLPATNGTSTYFLQTDGTGVTSWQPVSASVFTGILLGANGGTGVANTGKTITLGGDLATSGAFATTLTVTGATSLTLPTSGTVTALGNTVTGSGSIVLATSPALVTPALGVATATSIAVGGATIGSNGLAVTGHLLLEGVTSTGATGTGALVFAASPTLTGTAIAATLNATNFNGIIGTGTPAAGTFTTVTANTSVTTPLLTTASGSLTISPQGGNSIISTAGTFTQSSAGDNSLQAAATNAASSAFLKLTGRQTSVDSTYSIVSSGSGLGAGTLRFVFGNFTGTVLGEARPDGTWNLGAAQGAESLRVVPVASAVNFLQVSGAVTTGSPTIQAVGTDASMNLLMLAKGATGNVILGNDLQSISFLVTGVTSGANYITATGATASANPKLGTNANNLLLGSGSALATNATAGFTMIGTVAGTPTGAPTGNGAGAAAIIIDTTNHKICWNEGSTTWKCALGS